MEKSSTSPAVSIGVPVYNGARTIEAALDSLLAQSFSDFEIIISDNASNDATAEICADYAARDARIRYIRQPENIGGERNFKYVLDQATAPYFVWAAADDVRSADFLEVNVALLDANPDYVASTSPNVLEGEAGRYDFALEGGTEQRFAAFFKHCWKSHGLFYSVVRTADLRHCQTMEESFLAWDWAIVLLMASRGNLGRSKQGLITFGTSGESAGSTTYAKLRHSPVEMVLPFARLWHHTATLSQRFSFRGKVQLAATMVGLNARANFERAYALAYGLYRKSLRPLFRRSKA